MHCQLVNGTQLWVHAGLKVIRWAVLCMGTTWSGHKEIYWLVSCFSKRTLNIKSIKHAHKCTCMTHWQASSNSQNHVTCKDQLVSGGLCIKRCFQYEERKKAHYSFNSIWIREKMQLFLVRYSWIVSVQRITMETELKIPFAAEKEGNANYTDLWLMLGSYNCSHAELHLIYMLFETVNDYTTVTQI